MSIWQFAPITLQALQMGLAISGFNQYKGRLVTYAGELEAYADANRTQYLALRNHDPAFYTYYKSLPTYTVCDSAIKRSKGAAFYGYGSRLRRALKTNRGYTSLNKVHLNNMVSNDAVAQVSLTRAVQTIKENKYVDNSILLQWSAIVGAPVGVERFQSGASAAIIQQSFTSLKAFGQSFNSAGAAFGTSLFRILE